MVSHLSSKEMELVIQVQILDEAVFISIYANPLGKDINPSFLFK